MSQQEAKIDRVYWAEIASVVGPSEPSTIELLVKMDDGSYFSLAEYASGTNTIRIGDLNGETLADAKQKIESGGATIRNTAINIKGAD